MTNTEAGLEVVTFDEWKGRLQAGDPVEGLGVEELTLIGGLAYGELGITAESGSSLQLAHFHIDELNLCSSAARLEGFASPDMLEDGAETPQGAVMAYEAAGVHIAVGDPFELHFYDPRQRGAAKVGQATLASVANITITPYAEGVVHELPYHDLWRSRPTARDAAWQEYLDGVWPQAPAA